MNQSSQQATENNILDKIYDPKNIEHYWYTQWEKAGYFAPSNKGQSYCIMLPPPNITGSLHMGHGFQQTLMDALIRYHRMLGDNTLWQVGTDHAGISTQLVVENQLSLENKSRQQLGRENFVERIWQWKTESGDRITSQMRRIGCSADWSRERFTMDEGLSDAVQQVFIQLYEENLIYRGKRLVNWDPHFQTAVSDLEVIAEEEKGSLWYIRYPLVEHNEFIIVATTRPETLLGDVAVAVNPNDPRYQHLIGQQVMLPIAHRPIPIIADEAVEPTFGTGCVKITPAHDFNDYEMAKRHNLDAINIFTFDAKLNDQVPAAYQEMDRFKAREKIIADLTAQNLLEKIEPYQVKIPRGEKSGVVIEPMLTDQWFVKIAPLAEPAIKAVERGEIRFVPENWTKTFFQWMHNIQDWCISRQLWWGHRIPAWYDPQGQVYVGQNEADVRRKYKLDSTTTLKQEEDVLDTWFSSALWPFSTLGWPEQTPALHTFYPTQVLVTGFDIIFFWVARMIMMGLKFTGKIPFHEIYITGLIRDADGQKMSKSKGNVLDPLDIIDGIDLPSLIEKRTKNLMLASHAQAIAQKTKQEFPEGIPAFGVDALRFTYCAMATNGRNIRFDLKRTEGYRNFCNKLWNAARYVLISTEEHTKLNTTAEPTTQENLANDWILSRLQQVIAQAHQSFQEYRFDLLAQNLYDFVWHEYCDWYLELAKIVLNNPDNPPELKNNTRHTLLYVLENMLRLLHPIMPFITEDIWQKVFPRLNPNHQAANTIMCQAYPRVENHLQDPTSEKEIEWLKQVILSIRNIKGEMNIAPNKTLHVLFNKGTQQDRELALKTQPWLLKLAKLDSIHWLSSNEKAPTSATAVIGQLELLIPMAELFDKATEEKRLSKEIDKLQQELNRADKKLSNADFIQQAPAAIVNKEREKVAELQAILTKLETQLEKVKLL